MNTNLENITDDALFEKICLDILRSKEIRYETLGNSGSNELGRTVPDPVDGISIITDSFGGFIEAIVLECTSTKSSLKTKLLNEKGPNKGDIIKSIDKLGEIDKHKKGIKKTIVLCTNRRISSELTIELKTVCNKNKIELDIWEFSRIKNYLEINPTGQYIHHKYFSSQIELISTNLLIDITRKNIDDYKVEFEFIQQPIIRKNQNDLEGLIINSSGLIVLKGESGIGKSTTCIQIMESLVSQGIVTLKLSGEIIEKSTTIESAVRTVLKNYSPSLIGEPEQLVFSRKAVLFIDDINRSNKPQQILNKIESWINNKARNNQLNFTLVCPLWSRNVSFTPIVYEKNELINEFEIRKFTQDECDLFQALNPEFQFTNEIFSSLDYNPFLIGTVYKNRSISTKPDSIIEEHVLKEVSTLASNNNKFEEDYLFSLNQLVKNQLITSRLYPSESDLIKEFRQDQIQLDCLRELSIGGTIIYISKSFKEDNKVKFRHDKIHEYFIKKVISENLFDDTFKNTIIFNPYFSEYVGKILKEGLTEKFLNVILEKQPLIAFYYLKEIGEPNTDKEVELSNTIINWFDQYTKNEDRECSKFKALVNVLFNIESSVALKLSKALNHGYDKIFIGFNNGDLNQAINYFASHIDMEPSVGNQQRDKVILKYKKNYLEKSRNCIAHILNSDSVETIFKRSALIFAGYLELDEFTDTIIDCFEESNNKDKILTESIWAVLNCSGVNLKNDLSVLFDHWKTLPIDDGEYISSRSKVADRLKFSFNKVNNTNLDEVFVYYYDTCNELSGYMFRFLKELDTSIAIEKYLIELAEIHKSYLKNKGGFPLHLIQSDLLFKRDKFIVRNVETQNKLEEIWRGNQDSHLGKFAFDFWLDSINKSNLDLIKKIQPDSVYYNQSIEKRIELNDRSVTEQAFSLLKERSFRDSQNIWSEKLFELIRKELKDNLNIHISNYLLSIPEKHAEILLEYYDSNEHQVKYIFQYGLYIGTKKSTNLSKEIFENTNKKVNLFEHISLTFSNIGASRKKNLSIKKLNSLNGYIQYMSKEHLSRLLQMCEMENMLAWGKVNIGNSTGLYDDSIFQTNQFNKDKNSFFFPSLDDFTTKYFKNCRCNCNKYCRLSFWIDDIPKKGFTISEFKDSLKSSLNREFNLEKFKDVCAFFKLEGKRSDIEWIRNFTNSNPDKENLINIIEDTIFEIEKKNL